MLIYSPVKISISVEPDFKFVSPTIIVNRLPPTQLRVHNDTRTGTACSTSCSTLSSTTYCGTSTCAKRAKRSGCGASTIPRAFIPADTPPDASHSTPIVRTREICEGVQVEQTITPRDISVLKAPSAGPSVPDRKSVV